MKGVYITSFAIVFLCMVMFPLLSLDETVIPTPNQNGGLGSGFNNDETIRLYITEQDKVEEINMFDYVVGVVSAEMPAEYNEEALKAQAVAAYTFAKRKQNERKNEAYDLADTYKTDQAYYSETVAKERFGDNYEMYMEKIKASVKSVYGKVITYNGEVIFPAYHSVSAGKTESAENIWGEKYPYLIPVESVGDTLSPNYLSVVEVSPDEFKTKLEHLGISFSGDAQKWLGVRNCSESGTVLTQNICGTTVKGTDIRTALGLKSSVFELEYSDEKFKFTVMGYGHCVGMSQYGAQFMASEGKGYEDILKWYYPGCEITG